MKKKLKKNNSINLELYTLLCPRQSWLNGRGGKQRNRETPNSFSGKCHDYWDFAERPSKNTSIHTTRIASYVDPRVEVPPSLQAETRLRHGSHEPFRAIGAINDITEFVVPVRRIPGAVGAADVRRGRESPSPANRARASRLERRARWIREYKRARLGGWKQLGCRIGA